MGRYTGPVLKIARRLKTRLPLKGERFFSVKFDRRLEVPPGAQPNRRLKKLSNYGVQLYEKQKLRHAYGVREKQFRKYYEMAKKSAVTGEAFIQILESRLDNVVYRLGFGSSRRQARQWVTHKHFLVNGKVVNIPSYLIKPGDVVTVKENSRCKPHIQANYANAASRGIPEWLKVDGDKLEGQFVHVPNRDQVDLDVQENLIVEFYSR